MAGVFDWNQENRPPSREAMERIGFIFNRFTRLVKVHGGSMLPEACTGEEIPELSLPNILAEQWELSMPAYTCGCTGNTMFALPYEGEEGKPGFVRACAVCDHGPTWPRLRPANA